jgi:disulfide bond formation protein DsbB
LFDNFLGVAASEEFAPIRISLFTIFSANIICAINPKKLYFRVVGYGCGFVGSIIGLKSSCFLWAVYQTANMQDYTVAKKSLFEIGRCLFNIGTKCGIENNTIMGNVGGSHLYNLIERTHDNALVIISQSTFVYALSVYMLIFACMLIVLYTAFVCSAIRRG